MCEYYSLKVFLKNLKVYVKFKCDNKGSAIGNHLTEQHNYMAPNDIARSFKILRKFQNKLDCLIFEMLFIKELKLTLNKQYDSICEKLHI